MAEDQTAEGQATEGQAAEGQAAEGQAAKGQAAESQAAKGQAAESQAAESQAAESQAAKGQAAESQAAESQAAESQTAESQTAEGQAAEGQAAKGQAAEGQAAEGQATERQAAEGQATESQLVDCELALVGNTTSDRPSCSSNASDAPMSPKSPAEAVEAPAAARRHSNPTVPLPHLPLSTDGGPATRTRESGAVTPPVQRHVRRASTNAHLQPSSLRVASTANQLVDALTIVASDVAQAPRAGIRARSTSAEGAEAVAAGMSTESASAEDVEEEPVACASASVSEVAAGVSPAATKPTRPASAEATKPTRPVSAEATKPMRSPSVEAATRQAAAESPACSKTASSPAASVAALATAANATTGRSSLSPESIASPAERSSSDQRVMEVVQKENAVLREACRRFESELLGLSSAVGSPIGILGCHPSAAGGGGAQTPSAPSGRSTPCGFADPSSARRPGSSTPPHCGLGAGSHSPSKAVNAAISALHSQPTRAPHLLLNGGTAGASAHFDASSQLAAASARLSACAAHLASLAAKAALAPMHTTYAMLSEDIRLYEARCAHHLALHAPVHNAAISKVRSVAAQLWPRAQVKTFGSFSTGLMRPGSDIDLIVTLPPVRTTTAMPEAPGTLEGRNALPEETWQASLARCLKDQSWVYPESVRTIDALVPIVSFQTRFFVSTVGSSADGSSQTGTPLRLDVSFEGANHNGLVTNTFVQRTLAERPDVKPLTLVLKQFLAERSLDKPYLGGLSSYGLLVLVLRFLQTQDELTRGGTPLDEAESSLGARLVKLLDFYGRAFDPRNMGISVTRNRGVGEFIMRDHSQRVRVDLSQLHLHPQTGYSALPPQQAAHADFRYGGAQPARRPASESGDWCPSLEHSLSPSQRGVPRGAVAKGFDWPLHRPMRAASGALPAHRWRQHSVDGGVDLPIDGGADATAKFWFDPLYVEDPLEPSNNVGRNCFRIYAIQQELYKAHALCTMHPGEYPGDSDYPVLSRMCSALAAAPLP